jgi:glycosyltransferase involved in cell wall biosynthesis
MDRTPLVTRLLVVSHTPHHRTADGLTGWGPTVTELSHLAPRFTEVVHVAPVHGGAAPASDLPYTAGNVRLVEVAPAGGPGLRARLGLLAALPRWWSAIRRGRREADAVHVRAPAVIALVALVQLRLARDRRPCWVKYAGNWRPEGREPWSYRIQRRLLRRGFGRVVVTVNGPGDEPAHVVPFLNPSLTTEELAAGRACADAKPPPEPVALVFVGRVEDEKGAPDAVRVLAALRDRGMPATLDVVGDGPARPSCGALARDLGVSDAITLHGWLPRGGVHEVLCRSHVLLLPTRASEGWPKVLSEAMAFGVVPVASPLGAIPSLLGEAGLTAQGVDGIVECVRGLVGEGLDRRRAEGRARAADFGLARYNEAVAELFRERWGVELR